MSEPFYLTLFGNIRFLAYVDLLGTTYSASTIATGYGAHIAQPLLRKAVEGYEDVLTEEQALGILETCMKVLFYRDARSLNKVRRNWQCLLLNWFC
jgi:20S proteasome subunit beta 7